MLAQRCGDEIHDRPSGLVSLSDAQRMRTMTGCGFSGYRCPGLVKGGNLKDTLMHFDAF